MNHIRVQARLALGALLTAVLVLTVFPATSSAAPTTGSGTEAGTATAKAPVAQSSQANARRDCYKPNCYGAITMNMNTLKTFYGYNYGSRYNAERSQYKRCTRNTTQDRYCRKMGWVRNGCAAVGWKDKPDSTGAYWYSFQTGRSKNQAKYKVRKSLNFGSAQVLAWICTARNY